MVQGETGTGGDCWCRIASTVLEVLLTQALWFGVRIGWPARRLPRRSAGARPRRWGFPAAVANAARGTAPPSGTNG